MRLRFQNTKNKGLFVFLVYPEDKKFIGVCLTLNIVEEGENPQEILKNLIGAAFGHLEVVRKENLSDDLLNRPASKKYWDKYEEYKREQFLKSISRITKNVQRKQPIPKLIKHELAYSN